jgi:hypothetical protein
LSALCAAVYNLLLNAQLIKSDDRRREALLRAVTGPDVKLVFAAGLHMQRFGWPAVPDADLLHALVCFQGMNLRCDESPASVCDLMTS